MKIPLSAPDITEAEVQAVAAVLRTPSLSLGPKLLEFEAAFTSHLSIAHAIAVSSGTAGLHLAIRALNLGPGDEVLVPSFTFIAAANCILYEHATPVFVDIDPVSLNLSPASIQQALTARTRAIVVVHTFGRPAQLDAILPIARAHHLAIIEDACEAIGATHHGQQIGTFGDIAVFGFYPNKQITTGEGGMVVTRQPDLAQRIRALRNQGRGLSSPPAPDPSPSSSPSSSNDWFQHAELGYNYRLSEINCTLGIGQMRRLASILARRAEIARLYHRHLSASPHLVLPALSELHARLSWFVYVVQLTTAFSAASRDAIAASLLAQGIGCGRYFAPIHLQPAYAHLPVQCPLPVTEAVSQRTLALPFFNRITEAEIAEVCTRLLEAIDKLANCS